jgi:hypothetical protein
MNVLIPTALLSYTGGSRVEADGATAADVLADLDRRYPGIRFRVIDEQGNIRRNIFFFVARWCTNSYPGARMAVDHRPGAEAVARDFAPSIRRGVPRRLAARRLAVVAGRPQVF